MASNWGGVVLHCRYHSRLAYLPQLWKTSNAQHDLLSAKAQRVKQREQWNLPSISDPFSRVYLDRHKRSKV